MVNQQMGFVARNGSLITDALGDAGNSSQKRIFAICSTLTSLYYDWASKNTPFGLSTMAPATTSSITYQVMLATWQLLTTFI